MQSGRILGAEGQKVRMRQYARRVDPIAARTPASGAHVLGLLRAVVSGGDRLPAILRHPH
jgi:hypothetical protein